jgi:tetratricopeptide (TPR) repeat protein
MHPLHKRVLVYGCATPVVAALCYAGFMYEVPPDPEHFLAQAEIKLRFAAQLAPRHADGSEVPARQALIAEALTFVDRAEAIANATACSVEYRAYADYLRGDCRAAAATYARARTLSATPDARAELALSEGRMLAMAGDDTAALRALELAAAAPCVAAAAGLERARALHRLQQTDAAVSAASRVLELPQIDGQFLTETGLLLEDLDRAAAAATAFTRASAQYPLANYFGARLKARQGEADNALEMLECAVEKAGTAVRTLIKRDTAVWQPLASTTRFRKLFPEMEAAQPGR